MQWMHLHCTEVKEMKEALIEIKVAKYQQTESLKLKKEFFTVIKNVLVTGHHKSSKIKNSFKIKIK